MFYEPSQRNHGMRHDPFKALAVPRPIGWIGTLDTEGLPNLAPYSYFNAVCDNPAMVMFSSAGRKDSLRNIEATGEFTCSLSTWALREQMNLSSATVSAGVDEFALAALDKRPSRLVKPPSVLRSPAAFECRLWKTIALPPHPRNPEFNHVVVFGEVVGVHLDDDYIRDGRVDVAGMQPLARLGYMDYAVVNAQVMFEMVRPLVESDGRTVRIDSGPWDGAYR